MKITLFGSSGLIGNEILRLLENDNAFENVNVVSRRPIDLNSEKCNLRIIDFSDYSSYLKVIDGSDVVLAAIGTTQSQVSFNKKKYREIDFGIISQAVRACKEKNVKHFSFVSSAGADINNKSFYLKLKGEIEKEVESQQLKSSTVYRPSLLIGRRKENRFGEKIAQIIIPILSFLMPDNYKPIKASDVAKAMVNESKNYGAGFKIYHYNKILSYC
tara:strand:- start:1677 stop:2324 length:648 start_codon:yes stop_codon:yes gene_type:complete